MGIMAQISTCGRSVRIWIYDLCVNFCTIPKHQDIFVIVDSCMYYPSKIFMNFPKQQNYVARDSINDTKLAQERVEKKASIPENLKADEKKAFIVFVYLYSMSTTMAFLDFRTDLLI